MSILTHRGGRIPRTCVRMPPDSERILRASLDRSPASTISRMPSSFKPCSKCRALASGIPMPTGVPASPPVVAPMPERLPPCPRMPPRLAHRGRVSMHEGELLSDHREGLQRADRLSPASQQASPAAMREAFRGHRTPCSLFAGRDSTFRLPTSQSGIRGGSFHRRSLP